MEQIPTPCFAHYLFHLLMLHSVSLCGGPIILRMYRKRKAARLMFDSVELKMQSNQQSSQQERPVSKADAVPQFWTPVSSVESFCNTSYVAGMMMMMMMIMIMMMMMIMMIMIMMMVMVMMMMMMMMTMMMMTMMMMIII